MTSPYLNELLGAIRGFGESQTYALMRGPLYPAGGKFKTQREKNDLILTLKFQPTMLKPWPMLIFAAAVYVIHYFFQPCCLKSARHT